MKRKRVCGSVGLYLDKRKHLQTMDWGTESTEKEPISNMILGCRTLSRLVPAALCACLGRWPALDSVASSEAQSERGVPILECCGKKVYSHFKDKRSCRCLPAKGSLSAGWPARVALCQNWGVWSGSFKVSEFQSHFSPCEAWETVEQDKPAHSHPHDTVRTYQTEWSGTPGPGRRDWVVVIFLPITNKVGLQGMDSRPTVEVDPPTQTCPSGPW